jgi:hypothetical protein
LAGNTGFILHADFYQAIFFKKPADQAEGAEEMAPGSVDEQAEQ